MRLVPDPAAGAAVVLCSPDALGAAVAAGAVVAGWPAVVAVAAVALRLGRLLAALLIAPLPVLPAARRPHCQARRHQDGDQNGRWQRKASSQNVACQSFRAAYGGHGRGTREQWSAAALGPGIIRGGVIRHGDGISSAMNGATEAEKQHGGT